MSQTALGKGVAVIIPARNEQDTVAGVVLGVRDAIAPEHIIVVDDVSCDRTAELAEAAGASVVRTQSERSGLGAAMNLGVATARALGCETFLTIDADGQYNPQDLRCLLSALRDQPVDLVVGDRLSDGCPEWMTRSRYTANQAFSLLFSRIAKFNCPIDSQSGLRAFGVAAADLSQVRNCYTYTQEQLLRVQLHGLSLGSVPVTFGPRKCGVSRLISNTADYAWNTVPNLFKVYHDLTSIKKQEERVAVSSTILDNAVGQGLVIG